MTETPMNETILECPDFNEETNELLKNVSFWVEGFLSCVFAIIGILGNVGSAIVLSGKGKSKMEIKYLTTYAWKKVTIVVGHFQKIDLFYDW